MKAQAIIAAGGRGERMCSAVPKPLLLLGGEPVVVRTLRVFESCALVDGVVLVVPEKAREEYRSLVAAAGLSKVRAVVAGGDTRTQSVRQGLAALDRDTDMVIVHDAVRPFVTAVMIAEGVAAAAKDGAAIAGVPVKPTLKMVDPKNGMVTSTLDRSQIWEIQTPQVFKRPVLEKAYASGAEATDDAALAEQSGVPVRVFMGSYRNIKITTAEDMLFAEALLGNEK